MSKAKSLNIVGQEQEGISRRSFLKGLGGTVAAAAVAGCADSSKQNIYPNVKGDNKLIPGVATWYSSTCTQCDAGCGVLHRVVDGRVVKTEGNAEHPVNQGGLCAIGHSALQDHYDPDRIRQPLKKSKDENGKVGFKPITWKAAIKEVKAALAKEGKKAFITQSQHGSMQELLTKWTSEQNVEHHVFEPIDYAAIAEANAFVYGDEFRGIPEFDFSEADTILNFGADFLETWVSPCGYAKGWAKSRKSNHPVRVFHVEPRLSLTGANADHWLNCNPGTEVHIATAILKELVIDKQKQGDLDPNTMRAVDKMVKKFDLSYASKVSGVSIEKILLAVNYLGKARSALVLAGGSSTSSSSSYELNVIVGLLNRVLGNIGKTINLKKLRKPQTNFKSFQKFCKSFSQGDYRILFVDGSNPSFKSPSALKFDYGVKKLDLLISFASHMDETTKQADLILPSSTSFESWGDHSPYEGINSLVQPVMTEIFDTKNFGDSLLALASKTSLKNFKSYKEFLQDKWKTVHAASEYSSLPFEKFWEESVERGGCFAKETAEERDALLQPINIASFKLKEAEYADAKVSSGNLLLMPYASIKTFDGRAANRPWMQEIPDPITHVAWDTWAEINPKTAKKNNINTGDLVKVNNHYGELNVPAYVTEYVKEGVVAVPIGNGHTEYGRYAQAVDGGNVLDLIAANSDQHQNGLALFSSKVSVKRTLGKHDLVITQESDDQGERHIARTREIKEHHDDHHGEHHHHEAPQMYEQREHPVYEWGMAVDLAACTGCSACVAACYAENNIPTVGKKVMSQGREMSWLTIQTYDDGSTEDLQVTFLPMMCQHCNNAPCEPVCPVYATYHNEEGLNAMIYNRCVGTRYCSNNCVYKVRRFNWFEFDFPEPLDLQLNPDVTKRVAGVMEKCSFCVQRIMDAKDIAKDEGRLVKDGEVQPACVQSCPTEALVFGNLNDHDSKVSKMAHHERSYKILDHHLNTQPSVTYLDNLKYKA